MKLLLDHNLSPTLLRALADVFPDSEHVDNVGMAEAEDAIVWNYARTNKLTIVSKDWDFVLRSMLYGHPPKVIYVRLGNCPTSAVLNTLRDSFDLIKGLAESESESYLILPS